MTTKTVRSPSMSSHATHFRQQATAAAASMLMLAMATSVQAQATTDAAKDSQKIVITGTSIRGLAPIGASLNLMTRDDINATGATTSTELLRAVPELRSFNATGTNTGRDQANFVDQPAIHGIGAGRGGGGLTLVLVDGRRLPGAGINQTAPDAAVIPSSALERVEVMADGGSAIYGSDAVGGVLNFVTRRNFNGAETGFRVAAADGYKTRQFSQLLGKTWDGGSALLDYEYSGNTALNGRARGYVTNNQTGEGGPDSRSTTCSPANVTVGSQVFKLSPTAAPSLGRNFCDNNVANDIYPEQDRHNVFAKVKHDVNEGVSVYGSFLYSRRALDLRVAGSGVTSGATSFTVQGSNPFYIQMPGTAAGATQSVTYNPAQDFGTFHNNINTRTMSAAAGVDFDLPKGWNGKLEYNKGVERDDLREHGMNQALAAAAISAGTFNPYGLGAANSPGVLAAIGNFETRYYGRQTMDQFTAKADGTLMQLGAGALRAAVGLEHRKETFDALNSAGPVGGSLLSGPFNSAGSRSSDSAYAELAVPLVAVSQGLPAARKVDLSLAVRHDRYSDVGSTTNPKLGLNWMVVDGALLRGSVGQSFHAPSLADSGTAIDTRLIRQGCTSTFVGCATATPADYSVIIAGGNKLKPETARNLSLGMDLSPALLGEGLDASLTYFRIDYKDVISFPTFAPRDSTLAAYDKYRVLRPANATDAEWLAVLQPLFGSMRHDGQVYPDVSNLPLVVYDLRRQNFANEYIRGLDYRINKRFATAYGTFNLALTGTQMMRYDQMIPGVATTIKLLDSDYAVRNRYRAQLGWAKGDLAGSVFVNHTGGYLKGTQSVGSFDTVDMHLAWSLPSNTMLGKAQLSVDVSNLANTRPPVFYTSGSGGIVGFDPIVASPIGRMLGVALTKTW